MDLVNFPSFAKRQTFEEFRVSLVSRRGLRELPAMKSAAQMAGKQAINLLRKLVTLISPISTV